MTVTSREQFQGMEKKVKILHAAEEWSVADERTDSGAKQVVERPFAKLQLFMLVVDFHSES